MAADPQRAMRVSVVMPARDAEGTIGEALESLRAQTIDDWEVVVVDDGSRDRTRALVEELAARDPRIRVIDGPATGPAAARNAGIAAARFDWLAFLDADDWLEPEYLEALTGVLREDPALDGAHCGWARVDAHGALGAGECCTATGDLFPLLARACALSIHSCVVRRERVLQAGGFDPAYPHAEDWDLWQRVARTGALFGRVPRTLAYYRMRPGSVSLRSDRLLESSLRVLANGAGPDRRVADPDPADAAGVDVEPARRWIFAVWCAGAEIALGRDARPLLDVLRGGDPIDLDPTEVAETLRQSIPYGAGRLPADWVAVWPTVEAALRDFLDALEERNGTPMLARRAAVALERMALREARGPATAGRRHAVGADALLSIADVYPPRGVERLQVAVAAGGEPLGLIELPVCDGAVPGRAIADAVAAEHAWELLGRFFAGGRALDAEAREAHDRDGWTAMLRELWDRPDWDGGRFYDPSQGDEAPGGRRRAPDGVIAVEVAAAVPDVEVDGIALRVIATVGGAGLGVVEIPAEGGLVRAQAIRAAVTTASAFELCRIAVREGIVGRPPEAPGGLRDRLAAAAASAGPRVPEPDRLVLGRRWPLAIGGAPNRRAALPAAAAAALARAADAAGEPRTEAVAPTRAEYDPDWIPRISAPAAEGAREAGDPTRAAQAATAGRNRDHFETLFATGADPWRYTHPYESLKYRQTLDLLPPGPIGTALELACAEGHFTVQLAA
ncbi:MAG: hypothetical protein QOD86_2508, partial [Miltoncostaeaceae bacterium]|nr:hypothetical protein [Miltoncostaeaceae bacterium]